MRFPRLSHLFHRRAKSDPELSRLASAPIATPATRPVSTSYLAESLAPSTSSDLFTAYVSPAPLAFPAPPRDSHYHAMTYAGPPGAQFYNPPAQVEPVDHHHHHHRGIVAVLTHRIRDLEAALRNERATYAEALEANGGLADDVAALQAEVVHLRRELISALAHGQGRSPLASASKPGASDEQADIEALATENAALGAECGRLRRFVEVMLAVGQGEPKPVLESAYRHVLEGEAPEAALVAAIKHAVSQPGNVWRELLEPVTGVRTQEEYLAQVRCTLGARAQTQDWRKRAKFWKRAAREDGRHAETVTPSVSAISEVVDVLPEGRRVRVEGMMEQLRAGVLPLRVARAAAESEMHPVLEEEDASQRGPAADESREQVSAPVSSSSVAISSSSSAEHSEAEAASGALVEIDACVKDSTSSGSHLVHLPASSSSMVLPPVASTSTARVTPAHSNLPPLASEMFRTSYSIKSVSSKGSRRNSLGMHILTSPSNGSFGGNSRPIMSPSASASTQDSMKSRRRRAKIIAVPVPSVSMAEEGALAPSATKSTSRWSFFGASRSATSAVCESAPPRGASTCQPQPAEAPHSDSDARPGVFESSEENPSFEISVETVAEDSGPATPSRFSPTGTGVLPKALVDFSNSPEDDLVLVLHSDFSGSSYRAVGGPPASPTPGSGRSSANTTPEKRSRLPVRMPGLRAIKRFSASINISRPVLVETTNAGTFDFSTAGAGRGMEARGPQRSVMAAPSVVPGVRKGMGGASPPRPSKIPMGKRLHRFGIGGQVQ